MNKFPKALLLDCWPKITPSEIAFVPNEVFAKENKLEQFNPDFPKPYGDYVVLSRKHEYELFLKFNYAKYRATKVTDSKNIRIWLSKAAYHKEIIAFHNVPLVHYRRFKLRNVALQAEELESEAFYALNHAIDRFDVSRGNKFSTFLRKLINNFVFQRIRRFAKHRNNLSLDIGGGTENQFDVQSLYEIRRLEAAMDVQTVFTRNVQIKSRERLIVNKLFGLNGKKQVGLNNVAKEFGVSKQRINEIKKNTFQKVRDTFERVVEEDRR